MSALPPIADINPHRLECLLCANSRHSVFSQKDQNVTHRDAGGGAVHSIKSGHGGNKTAAAEKLQIDFDKERGGLRMVIAIAQERAIT